MAFAAGISWDVTWRGAGLPLLSTAAVAAFRVAESQALNTSGGTSRPPGAKAVPARAATTSTYSQGVSVLQAAPCLKSDGWQTTAARRPGPAERQPGVDQRYTKGLIKDHARYIGLP